MTNSASTLPFPNRKPRNQLVPEINVTPLVDVVLVLLIIFMVIAPQLEAVNAWSCRA
jgi:biopolymer transport protein ExbD